MSAWVDSLAIRAAIAQKREAVRRLSELRDAETLQVEREFYAIAINALHEDIADLEKELKGGKA